MLQATGIGCLNLSESTIEAAPPVAQTMNTLPAERPSAAESASCSGSAPHAYQMNPVSPAETAAALSSRMRERELHAHEVRIAARPCAEAEARGEAKHGAVAAAHQAVQHRQTRAARMIEQPLHELAAHAKALQGVRHDERDLAAGAFGQRDERAAVEGREAGIAGIQGPRRALELLRRELGDGGKIALAPRARREPAHERLHHRGVLQREAADDEVRPHGAGRG